MCWQKPHRIHRDRTAALVRIVIATLLAACCSGLRHPHTVRRELQHSRSLLRMSSSMETKYPVVKDLVLIGGGHAHVHVLKMLGMHPLHGVQLTLITRDVETPYSGMLPGHVAGHYSREECHIDLNKLARFAKARLIHTSAIGLDPQKRQIICADGRPPVRYDVCSLDVGSTPQFIPQKSAADYAHVTPVKPIDGFSARWDTIVERLRSTQAGTAFRVVIVGAGAGGVELALSVQHRLQNELKNLKRDPNDISVAIVTRTGTVLPSHNSKVKSIFTRILNERGVRTHLGSGAAGIVENGSTDAPTDITSNGDTVSQQQQHERGGHVTLEDDSTVPYDEVIWCTGSGAPAWFRETGLSLDSKGFIAVTETLQCMRNPEVFAVGDCAAMIRNPRPKAGVFAVRQGAPLLANLRAFLQGLPLQPFTPQTDFMGIIGTGSEYAVVSRGGWTGEKKGGNSDNNSHTNADTVTGEHEHRLAKASVLSYLNPLSYLPKSSGSWAFEGPWAWYWKVSIDKKWMAMYQNLPDMDSMKATKEKSSSSSDGASPTAVYTAAGSEAQRVLEQTDMRCGGCGSKVGPSVLSQVLKTLAETQQTHREDNGHDNTSTAGPSDSGDGITPGKVLVGLDSADDAAVVLPPTGLVHTVDFFKAHISDPYVFGQIAANHALSDAHAMGAQPSTALAIAVVPHSGEAQAVNLLTQLMAGAMQTLSAAGCQLIGGHTSEGSELALGFSINAVADTTCMLTKGGMQVGDALILTKPLGTGCILAGDMQGKAKGAWYTAAVANMLQSNGPAAKILQAHAATSATDVTGFGLAGHLLEMVRASSSVAVKIDLDNLPVLSGAAQCIDSGFTSSLHPANKRAASCAVDLQDTDTSTQSNQKVHICAELLYDPQTAGGLLATVSNDTAQACLDALRAAGYGHAAIIGQVAVDNEGAHIQCTSGLSQDDSR